MESESITFGYLRRDDIEYTENETFLPIHIICNNGVSKTYNIYFNFYEDVEEYHELICHIINNKIRDHPEMDYLSCTIKEGLNNTEYIELEDDFRTIRFCGLTDTDKINRDQCIEFINSILHY